MTASLQQQMKEIQTMTSGESSQLAEQLTVAQKAREQLEAQLETANKTKTRYQFPQLTFFRNLCADIVLKRVLVGDILYGYYLFRKS